MSREGISTQPRGRGTLLGLLKETQTKHGYVPEAVMAELAASLEIPINEVYGVATFYSFISVKPLGRNVIRVCKSLPCYLQNYPRLISQIERQIGIKPGETTPDNRFSLQLTNCIGACDQAPAMMINRDVYGNLTPEKIASILTQYK